MGNNVPSVVGMSHSAFGFLDRHPRRDSKPLDRPICFDSAAQPGTNRNSESRMRTLVFALVIACPPFLKAHILRWFCGAKIGRYVYIGWFSTVMGRNIELDDHAEIRSVTIIRCDGEVRIGAYSVISNFVLVYGSASFIVGNHCYIGPQCL